MSKVIIVGGGAAGMMAAVTAAENGKEVELFEKNDKLGKKLFANLYVIFNTSDTKDFVIVSVNFLQSMWSKVFK